MSQVVSAAADRPDRRAEVLGLTVFITTFATVFVLARLYTRLFTTRSFGWDDGFIAAALAASWAGQAMTIEQINHGLGLPTVRVDLADRVLQAKYSQMAVLVNGIAMMLMKIGIGLSLIRIRMSKHFNYAVMACIALSVLVNLCPVISTFASCRPMAKRWNRALPGDCWPKRANLAFSYTQTVGNIVTDLAFTLGPLYFLSKVKVSRYNKWALRGVFLIGLLATACAIAKATQLPVIDRASDPTYETVNLTIWVKAELSAGLFAASIPPLKNSFEYILVHWFGVTHGINTSSGTRSKGHAYGNSHTFRSSRRPNPGESMGTGFEEEYGHGPATYVMGEMGKIRKKDDNDEISMEDDRKHILHSGSVKTGSDGNLEDGHNDQWITKTIEYTISDEESRTRRSSQH